MQLIKRGTRELITNGEYKGLYIERVIIAVDTADELEVIKGKTKLACGSIAWILNTGDIYALNSKDEWKIQPNATITL